MSLRGQHGGVRPRMLADASRFLIVTVGGTPMALHADSVQGLLTPEESGSDRAPVVHGQAYPAVNLVARIGVLSDQDGAETRIVLLASGRARGSLRVAQVHGLEEVERSRVLALPPQFRGEEREWYRGILMLATGIAVILDLAWLLGVDRLTSTGSGDERRLESAPRQDVRPELATKAAA